MGEVINLRVYRYARDGDMPVETARRLIGYIDFKVGHKRAMDERDRLEAEAKRLARAEKRRNRKTSTEGDPGSGKANLPKPE